MLHRTALVLVSLALVVTACTGGDGAAPAGTTASTTAPVVGTSLPETSSSSTASSTSTPTSETIPPVTPPANQPEACVVLASSAGLDPAVLASSDEPNGLPAPSTGCRTTDGDPVRLALFYGRDPLETLAIARVQRPGGTDIVGIGQDAYYVSGAVYVDTGSRAFAVTGELTQEALESLADDVVGNL